MKSVRCCPFLFDVLVEAVFVVSVFPDLGIHVSAMTNMLCFGMLRTNEDNSS